MNFDFEVSRDDCVYFMRLCQFIITSLVLKDFQDSY